MHSISKTHEGGKAQGLRMLQAKGFRVPDFIVVQSNTELATIAQFIQQYPEVSFAVRSSSLQEDGVDHSFAGQFETFLEVRGIEAVEKAVKACFVAADSNRVAAYTKAKRLQKDAQDAMAVIIQVMIQAEYAGVAFSVDPVQNRRDLCLIQYVKGAGHQLVDGLAKAASIVLSKKQKIDSTESPIPIHRLKELQEGMLLLEQESPFPVDIEWVIDKHGQLFWLQLRPVT